MLKQVTLNNKMNLNYDECLEQNPFFQLIQENHSDVITKATIEGWIICIPRLGTFEPTTISTEDLLEHVLVPNYDLPDTHFYTLTKHEVSIRDRHIVFKGGKHIRILFDETFYIERSQKYKLWCVERPLHQNCPPVTKWKDCYNIRSVHDCVKVLWKRNRGVLDDINKVIETFIMDSFECDDVEMLKDKCSVLYVQCVELFSKECISDNLALAVETYVHYCIHHKLFPAVCNFTSQVDANFNKIVRNLFDIQLKDLEISNEFLENIASTKRELSNLNKYSTVLGKIECLRRVINSLSNKKQSFVTTDDLLKIFVFTIIKSKVNNWTANLTYLTNFRYSALNLTHENSFLITTLEAAIEFIKTQEVRPKSGLCSPASINSVNDFFSCVEAGNLSAIRKFCDSKVKNMLVDRIPLCHPLCSCEKCKPYTPFSINTCNDKGCTALHVACLHGQPLVVEYLLGKGVEINALDYAESMPLHYAALKGSQNALLLLLHANAELEPRDSDGNTPLHLAANNGHESCVKALLYFVEQKGGSIDVNSKNNMGETPLHYAAKWGYVGIANILLQYGAKTTSVNKRNQNALDVVHSDYLKKLLLAAKADETKTHLNFNRIKLDSSPQIKNKNIEQLKKIDLLLKSIENNDLPLMCFYLGIPTPQNVKHLDTKATCHPLCTCDNCQKQFENSSPPALEPSQTLNINACNSDGYSPLHIAAKCGRSDILRLLLDSGALVNIKTSTHLTPLHLACKNQRIQIVRELLKCGGCDLDVQDLKGNTPMHYACLSNDSRIVELLLGNGSDCNIKNGEGKTPLQEAKGRMLCNIVKLLKGKCGNSNSSDSLSDLFSL